MLSLLPILLLAATPPEPPRGVFGLTNTHNWVTVDGRRVDLYPLCPVGLTNYGHWREVEPERGSYRWGGLHRLADEARSSGKRLAYGLLAGVHHPAWVEELPGVLTISQTRRDGRTERVCLPWTIVDGRRQLNEALLTIWRETVLAFAAELRTIPDYRDLFAYVPVTGGPTSNGLEVMWAVDRAEDFTPLVWDGEADRLLTESWVRCAAIFCEALPDLPLGLAVTDYVGRQPDGATRRSLAVPRGVLDGACAAADRAGALLAPMGLWAGIPGLQSLDHPLVKLLASYRPRPIGLQGQMGTPTAEGLEEMLRFGDEVGAAWIEVWHHDLLRPEYAPLLAEWSGRYLARR